MELAALPTETDGHRAITVRDEAPSPSISNDAMQEVSAYILLLMRTFFICLFAGIRKWGFEESNPFKSNLVFAIIALVAFYAVVGVGASLWSMEECLYLPAWGSYFSVLKLIGTFLAFLALFSILMVLVLPPKLNWTGYLVACVMFGIMVTCFYLDDHQQDKRSSRFNAMVLFLVFALMFLALSIPTSINPIAYAMMYLALGLESAYHFITCLMFINEKTRKPSNLETHHKDKNNNHSRENYLPIFRIN